MEYSSSTINNNKFRILLGFIITPFLTAAIFTFLRKPVHVSTFLIPHLSTLIVAVPYFFYIYKKDKVNFQFVTIGAVFTSISIPLFFSIFALFSSNINIPIHHFLGILFFFFVPMGFVSGILFWLISINKNWSIFDIKEIITSFIVLAVIVVLFCEIGSIYIRYSYVLTWGFITVLSYSFLTTKKIHPTNNRIRLRSSRAGYGLLIFTPLAIISFFSNIKESAAVTFTILIAILTTDGYQIFTRYKK